MRACQALAGLTSVPGDAGPASVALVPTVSGRTVVPEELRAGIVSSESWVEAGSQCHPRS